jgi:hypothetical protein
MEYRDKTDSSDSYSSSDNETDWKPRLCPFRADEKESIRLLLDVAICLKYPISLVNVHWGR